MSPEPFDHQAQFYADYRPIYPEEMYRFIFSHLKRRQFAWDCATGSGQIARYLSDHFEAVDANDISSGQLRHAVQKKNISYTLCSVYETPYPEHRFDLIIVGQAIHWLDRKSTRLNSSHVAISDAVFCLINKIGRGLAAPPMDWRPRV